MPASPSKVRQLIAMCDTLSKRLDELIEQHKLIASEDDEDEEFLEQIEVPP
jgi:hypothetical protein